MDDSLGPSTRVRLIKAIASKAIAEDETAMLLTLRTFGLYTPDVGSDDPLAYVMHVCESAVDGALLALAEHYGLEPAQAALSPDFWQPGIRLFISHVSAEKTLASSIRDEAKTFGISGFVAHEDIAPSVEWLRTIEEALRTCDAFAAVLTKGFRESDWTDQESGFAVARRVVIAPVRVDLLPYGFLSRYQAVDGRARDPKKIARALLDVLVTDPRTSQQAASALVSAFERSRRWPEAIASSIAIESHPALLTQDFRRRLRAAVASNSTIAGSWGVPERIARLTTDLAEPPF